MESRGEILHPLLPLRIGNFLRRYGLVTEQRKGSYLYFMDLGDRMEVANSRTAYVDEVSFTPLSHELSGTQTVY